MPIESATNISQLNTAYPASTDGVKEGDDHIRLIKQVLQSTFPNITGAVTKTQTELNRTYNEVPIGVIMMWSGANASIPSGYALCTGQTVSRTDGAGTITTPDLRDRFIVGSGTTYATGNTGGANTVTLSTGQLPSHTHTLNLSGSVGAAGAHSHSVNDPGHAHGITIRASDRTGAGNGFIAGPNTANFGYGTDGAGTGISINGVADHTHALSLSGSANATGSGDAHENRPPYFALAFIMKV